MPPIPTTDPRPFIPAAGGAQVELIYTYLGQRCENVYHVHQSGNAGSVAPADLTAIANAALGWGVSTNGQQRSNACNLVLVRARDLFVEAGVVIETATGLPSPGLDGNQPLPGNVTVAIKWVTGFGGRSFRGRTYHIGVTAGKISGDQLLSTVPAGMRTNYLALRDAFNALTGMKMSVCSYAHNKFWRDAAVMTDIADCSVDINVDSQRRRLTGRGQ